MWESLELNRCFGETSNWMTSCCFFRYVWLLGCVLLRSYGSTNRRFLRSWFDPVGCFTQTPAVTSRRRDPSRPAARIRGASWWWTWPNMPRKSRTGIIPTREFSRFWGVSLQKIEWYPVGPPLLQCFMVFFFGKKMVLFSLMFLWKGCMKHILQYDLFSFIYVSVLILNSSFGCLLFVAPLVLIGGLGICMPKFFAQYPLETKYIHCISWYFMWIYRHYIGIQLLQRLYIYI